MATAIGTQDVGIEYTPLAAELTEDACSFEFFQAVALLQRLMPERQPVGEFSAPEDEVTRFRVNPRLAFPASEIQEFELREDAPAEMMVNFLGLTGPMGVLPHPYSELILERLRARDAAAASFFDLFNHRAISLLYRAWERSHFPVTFASAGRDRFSQYLLDLLGLGTLGLQDRQAIEDEALTHYLSLVTMHSRSAVALEQILTDYFEVPVAVEQFTGSWVPLDSPIQCSMGDEDSVSCQLGKGAVAGDAVWDHQGRIRLRIGPLSLERYNDFLPGGAAHVALQAMVRFYTNGTLEAEAQLVLERGQVPRIRLDFDSDQPARLGWISWAMTAPLGRDPDDAILAL
jgi:type VI secretion system protein ImpH